MKLFSAFTTPTKSSINLDGSLEEHLQDSSYDTPTQAPPSSPVKPLGQDGASSSPNRSFLMSPIAFFQDLKKNNANNNSYTYTPNQLLLLPRLQNVHDKTLKEITLNQDTLKDSSVMEVAAAIQKHQCLEKVILDLQDKTSSVSSSSEEEEPATTTTTTTNSSTVVSTLKELLSGLKQQQSVVSLEIHHLCIDKNVAGMLSHALSQNDTIQKLSLHSCHFDNDVVVVAFSMFLMGVQHSSIRQLQFQNVPLPFECMQILSTCMNLMQLKQLILVNNGLSQESMHCLCQAIMDDSTTTTNSLVDLDLSYNHHLNIPSTMKLLALTLATSKIQSVKLAHCQLDVSHVHILSKQFVVTTTTSTTTNNTPLKKINLSGNRLGIKAVPLLKKMLIQNTSIQELILEDCGMDGPHLLELNNCLRYNASYFLKNVVSTSTGRAILDTVDLVKSVAKDGPDLEKGFGCNGRCADDNDALDVTLVMDNDDDDDDSIHHNDNDDDDNTLFSDDDDEKASTVLAGHHRHSKAKNKNPFIEQMKENLDRKVKGVLTQLSSSRVRVRVPRRRRRYKEENSSEYYSSEEDDDEDQDESYYSEEDSGSYLSDENSVTKSDISAKNQNRNHHRRRKSKNDQRKMMV